MFKRFVIESKWRKRFTNILELLLVIFSIYFILTVVFSFWYTPTKWGYLAGLLIGLYAFIFLIEISLNVLKNITKAGADRKYFGPESGRL